MDLICSERQRMTIEQSGYHKHARFRRWTLGWLSSVSRPDSGRYQTVPRTSSLRRCDRMLTLPRNTSMTMAIACGTAPHSLKSCLMPIASRNGIGRSNTLSAPYSSGRVKCLSGWKGVLEGCMHAFEGCMHALKKRKHQRGEAQLILYQGKSLEEAFCWKPLQGSSALRVRSLHV